MAHAGDNLMHIDLTKEFMYMEFKSTLQSLFNLPEIEKIEIKGIQIPSLRNEDIIKKAFDKSFHDKYSDVDIQIGIKLDKEDYSCDSYTFLKKIGIKKEDILGMSYSHNQDNGEVIRLCKTNSMRYDLIINAVNTKGEPILLFNNNYNKADNFWFIAVQALGKLMRKDYLISSHLAHMLIQEGLVLQMEMRDKEKNTNIHRYGYEEELEYLKVFNDEDSAFARTPNETYNYISKLLYSAVKSYDRLSYLIDNSYKQRFENYLEIWACYF
ncbi:MAG: hypothetical protein Q8920_09110 [Bacillota bacterium]|nr:hypothetical protein [Bacillota bacterium]